MLLVLQAVPSVNAQETRGRDNAKDCSLPLTGAIPLNDLAGGEYQGFEGGLYPGGTNEIPAEHATLGLWQASQIQPLDTSGSPDPDGTIVFISIGVSNTRREFAAFQRQAEGTTAPDIFIINGAQGGKPISDWLNIEDRTWDSIDSDIRTRNLDPLQVQAAWVKLPERISEIEELEPFPMDAQTYQADLAQVMRSAKARYPNLRVAYLSSRIYAGFTKAIQPSPEPLAYQHGFGVKWTIERQINGDAELNADPRRGEVNAPWLAWGPYLWADGTAPRSDGLTWECGDLANDGIHPSSSGSSKVGNLLLEQLLTNPTSSPWFAADGEPIAAFELAPLAADSSTTTTSAPTTTTTSAPTTTTTVRDDGSTVADDRDRGDRGDRPDKRQARQESSDPAPATLGLLAAVLLLVVVLGAFGLATRFRRHQD